MKVRDFGDSYTADDARTYGLSCPEHEKMTQECFAADSDINHIVSQYSRTGVLPTLDHQAVFDDLVGLPQTYHEALNLVMEADEAFDSLPAELRARFSNDPGQLLHFLADPSNRSEAEKLGIVAKQADSQGDVSTVPASAVVGATGAATPVVPPPTQSVDQGIKS